MKTEDIILYADVRLQLTPDHARLIRSLAPRKRGNGTAYWAIASTVELGKQIGKTTRETRELLCSLERKGLAVSRERDEKTSALMWRLTNQGQQILIRFAQPSQRHATVG